MDAGTGSAPADTGTAPGSSVLPQPQESSARSSWLLPTASFSRLGCVSAAAVNLALRSSQKLGFQLQMSDGDKSLQALAPPDDHGRLSPGSKAKLLCR